MPDRLPSLNALRAFDAAARRLNFARAAADLAVTPGAVSRQIQILEEALGHRLFVRGNRAVELTAQGQAYARHVHEAFDRLAMATEQVRGRGAHGPLSICAYPTFAMHWLVPRWRRFNDKHPDIDLQLTTSLGPIDIMRDGFDAAVRIGDGNWPGHGSVWLAAVEVFPVCSPALAERIHSPADLRDQVLIHSNPRPDDWPRWLKAAGATGVDAARGPRFETMSLAFQAAIEGVGVAMGLGCLIAEDLALGRLAKPLAFTHRSRREFHLVYPQSRAADPRLAAFRAFLAEEAEAQPA
ncbi:MAG: transcriptional regulator GcvA [Reyranellaceae bacterium]